MLMESLPPVVTVAVMVLSETSVKATDWLAMRTLLTVAKFCPLMVTRVPVMPLVGEKEVIVGDKI